MYGLIPAPQDRRPIMMIPNLNGLSVCKCHCVLDLLSRLYHDFWQLRLMPEKKDVLHTRAANLLEGILWRTTRAWESILWSNSQANGIGLSLLPSKAASFCIQKADWGHRCDLYKQSGTLEKHIENWGKTVERRLSTYFPHCTRYAYFEQLVTVSSTDASPM